MSINIRIGLEFAFGVFPINKLSLLEWCGVYLTTMYLFHVYYVKL
jgi:hypothetical protein